MACAPWVLPLFLCFAWAPASVAQCNGSTPINKYQVVASHDSYHVSPEDGVLEMFRTFQAAYANSANPSSPLNPMAVAFTHPALSAQAEMGIRGFEFDVYMDPGITNSDGTMIYSSYNMPPGETGHDNGHPAVIYMAIGQGKATAPAIPNGELLPNTVGELKVLHIPDVDVGTTCYTFKSCLTQLFEWHKDNTQHHPIVVKVDPIEYQPDQLLVNMGIVLNPVPSFDSLSKLMKIEEEIHEVFQEDLGAIIKPDDVQGSAVSLEAAVTTSGWPTVSESQGKFLFLLASERGSATWTLYTNTTGEPSLANRTLFAFGLPGDSITAFVKATAEPLDTDSSSNEAKAWVESGFIVSATTDVFGQKEDANLMRADANRAVASGAQLLWTDCFKSGTCADEYVIQVGEEQEEAYCGCVLDSSVDCYSAAGAPTTTGEDSGAPTPTVDGTTGGDGARQWRPAVMAAVLAALAML